MMRDTWSITAEMKPVAMTYDQALSCPQKTNLNPAEIATNKATVDRLEIPKLVRSANPRATSIIPIETTNMRNPFVMCNSSGSKSEPEKGFDVGMLTKRLRNIPKRNSMPNNPSSTIARVTSLSLRRVVLFVLSIALPCPRSKLLVKFYNASVMK